MLSHCMGCKSISELTAGLSCRARLIAQISESISTKFDCVFGSSLPYRHVSLYVHNCVGTPVVARVGNSVHVANPGLVGQTKHRFYFATSEQAMSTTAHHFVIMLKPLRQKATSASCHFNVLSVFFLCVFAPHFSEASSLLPTAIGYESAAKLSLKHVTYNEKGAFHPKRSDLWLSY